MSGSGSGDSACAQRADVTEFDYVMCVIPDVHGSPRGRIVPRHLVPKVLKDGVGIFQGQCPAIKWCLFFRNYLFLFYFIYLPNAENDRK